MRKAAWRCGWSCTSCLQRACVRSSPHDTPGKETLRKCHGSQDATIFGNRDDIRHNSRTCLVVNLVAAQSYILNEQQSHFRATYTVIVQYDAGQLQSTRDLVLCSWQRPSGWNILHHNCYVCSSETTLLFKCSCCSEAHHKQGPFRFVSSIKPGTFSWFGHPNTPSLSVQHKERYTDYRTMYVCMFACICYYQIGTTVQ